MKQSTCVLGRMQSTDSVLTVQGYLESPDSLVARQGMYFEDLIIKDYCVHIIYQQGKSSTKQQYESHSKFAINRRIKKDS